MMQRMNVWRYWSSSAGGAQLCRKSIEILRHKYGQHVLAHIPRRIVCIDIEIPRHTTHNDFMHNNALHQLTKLPSSSKTLQWKLFADIIFAHPLFQGNALSGLIPMQIVKRSFISMLETMIEPAFYQGCILPCFPQSSHHVHAMHSLSRISPVKPRIYFITSRQSPYADALYQRFGATPIAVSTQDDYDYLVQQSLDELTKQDQRLDEHSFSPRELNRCIREHNGEFHAARIFVEGELDQFLCKVPKQQTRIDMCVQIRIPYGLVRTPSVFRKVVEQLVFDKGWKITVMQAPDTFIQSSDDKSIVTAPGYISMIRRAYVM